jgi:uncharacterized protein YggU (UPF0235/DUF167 family)
MYVHVRVTPGGKREFVTKVSDTEYELMVREPAERNLANRRVIELIARVCNTLPKNVKILTGHRSSSKMLSVETEN